MSRSAKPSSVRGRPTEDLAVLTMDPAQLLQERLWRAHLPQDSSPLPAELQEAALHDLRPTTDLPDGRAPGPHHGRGPAAPTGMDTRPELAMDWPTLGQH